MRKLAYLSMSAFAAAACVIACGGASGRATTMAAPMVFSPPRDAGLRFRSDCSVRPDGSGADTGTVELSLVAEDEATSRGRWRRVVHSIWGRYGPNDCITIERMWLAADADGRSPRRILVARTTDGSFYMLDPRDGRPMDEALWPALDALPPFPDALKPMQLERIPVASTPGFAFRLRLRNDGPPLLVEPHSRLVAIEVGEGRERWRRVVDEGRSDEALRPFGRGEHLDVVLSAGAVQAIRSAPAGPLRAVFVVYPLGANGLPSSPSRAIVPLPTEMPR